MLFKGKVWANFRVCNCPISFQFRFHLNGKAWISRVGFLNQVNRPIESNFRAFQNLVSEHSIEGVPTSLYNRTKSVPDPSPLWWARQYVSACQIGRWSDFLHPYTSSRCKFFHDRALCVRSRTFWMSWILHGIQWGNIWSAKSILFLSLTVNDFYMKEFLLTYVFHTVKLKLQWGSGM